MSSVRRVHDGAAGEARGAAMTPARWERVTEVLGGALERPAGERAAYLDLVCGSDAALRQEIESLLAACADADGPHGTDGADDFLVSPLARLAERAPDHAPAAVAGDRLGRYRVLGPLGRGGMGEVYLAEDPRLGRRVALKLLPAHVRDDADRLRRFAREARAASALSHPNVCVVHEVGETAEGRPFLAMEYVEGTSLRARLEAAREDGGRLPLAEAVAIAAQAAAGLAAAHAAGVIHRDVKPENLLVRPDGLVKVVDFGLAARMGPAPAAADGEALERSEHTAAGVVLGTVPYMSPEQLRGYPLDGRTDVWSLGAVLYELVAGQPPFGGATRSNVVVAVLEREPPAMADVAPEVPTALQATVARALRKDREARHASMAALADELCTIGDALARPDAAPHAPGTAGRAPAAPASLLQQLRPRSRRSVLMVAAAVAVIAAGTTAGVTWRWQATLATVGPPRVLVAAFENRTGDPTFDLAGDMTADWIAQGLQQTGLVDVVDPSVVLGKPRSVSLAPERATGRERAAMLARDVGATLVVWGAIYRQGDSLHFRGQVTDVARSRQATTLEPAVVAVADPVSGAQQMRSRVAGALASLLDARIATLTVPTDRPPEFAAYREYVRGLEAFRDSRDPIASFANAARLDSSFSLPLIWAAFWYGNAGHFVKSDSVVRILATRRARLTPLDLHALHYFEARRAGDVGGAIAAAQAAARLSPGSNWSHNAAGWALVRNRPREALRYLRQIDPERGWARTWFSYWKYHTAALHVLGDYEEELRVARRALALAPLDPFFATLETRALIALGRLDDVDRRVAEVQARSGSARAAAEYLRLAALELHAHGHRLRAKRVFQAAIAWYRSSAADRFVAMRPDTAAARRTLRRAEANTRYDAGQWEDAGAIFEALAARDSTSLELRESLGLLAARRGDRAGAEAAIRLLERPPERGVPMTIYQRDGAPLAVAEILAVLGDRERAVAQLREVLTGHGNADVPLHLHRHPNWEGLRDYPPFQELARPGG